ncbi:MAG: hypothetical protein U0797_00720 [Gemmataceae bacterium]
MTADHLSTEAKMTALALTFPSMAKASGVRFWDAIVLNHWVAETPLSPGEVATARFLLAVWDPVHGWRPGRFDLMEAVRVWDPAHRSAFLAWVGDPWWPCPFAALDGCVG